VRLHIILVDRCEPPRTFGANRGSHSALGDRQARLSGAECRNIRRRRNSPKQSVGKNQERFPSGPRTFGANRGSHFASKATGARSREPRAKIFAAGEIPRNKASAKIKNDYPRPSKKTSTANGSACLFSLCRRRGENYPFLISSFGECP